MFLFYLRTLAVSMLILTGNMLYTAESRPKLPLGTIPSDQHWTLLEARIGAYKDTIAKLKDEQASPTDFGVSFLDDDYTRLKWNQGKQRWLEYSIKTMAWTPINWDPIAAINQGINQLKQKVAQLKASEEATVQAKVRFIEKQMLWEKQQKNPNMLWRYDLSSRSLIEVGEWPQVLQNPGLHQFELVQWNTDKKQLDKWIWDHSSSRWINYEDVGEGEYKPTTKQPLASAFSSQLQPQKQLIQHIQQPLGVTQLPQTSQFLSQQAPPIQQWPAQPSTYQQQERPTQPAPYQRQGFTPYPQTSQYQAQEQIVPYSPFAQTQAAQVRPQQPSVYNQPIQGVLSAQFPQGGEQPIQQYQAPSQQLALSQQLTQSQQSSEYQYGAQKPRQQQMAPYSQFPQTQRQPLAFSQQPTDFETLVAITKAEESHPTKKIIYNSPTNQYISYNPIEKKWYYSDTVQGPWRVSIPGWKPYNQTPLTSPAQQLGRSSYY